MFNQQFKGKNSSFVNYEGEVILLYKYIVCYIEKHVKELAAASSFTDGRFFSSTRVSQLGDFFREACFFRDVLLDCRALFYRCRSYVASRCTPF